MLIDYGIFAFTGIAIKLGMDKVGLTDMLYDWYTTIIDGIGVETESEKIITLGHSYGIFKKPIKLDLGVFPSISITGISNSGKSKMVEYLMLNTNIKKVLLNAYKYDFKGVNCERIVNVEDIEKFLEWALEGKNNEPLLLVFDECLTLMSYKSIAKKLHILLTKNRHMDIYVICIFQELNKTIVPFKSLFTARVVLRQIQQSDVSSALGTTLEDYKPLKNREFILLSDDIYYGKTYDLKI